MHTVVCAIMRYLVPPVYLVSCASLPKCNGVCVCAVLRIAPKPKNFALVAYAELCLKKHLNSTMFVFGFGHLFDLETNAVYV